MATRGATGANTRRTGGALDTATNGLVAEPVARRTGPPAVRDLLAYRAARGPMSDRAKTEGAARRRRELVEDAVEIIEREFGRGLTLSGVARRIGASTRNLQRAFAETAGTSFSQHLRQVRMERAAELLQHSVLPIKAIANTVGYRHPADFSNQFRAHFGYPPKVLRSNRQAARA